MTNIKRKLNQKYKEALQKGERFWPDSIYKDLLGFFCTFHSPDWIGNLCRRTPRAEGRSHRCDLRSGPEMVFPLSL